MHILTGIIGGTGVTVPKLGTVAIFEREEGCWGFSRFATAGDSLEDNQLGVMLPADLPVARDQAVPIQSGDARLIYFEQKTARQFSFREMLNGDCGEEAKKDALAADVINAQESKEDLLRHIAGLQDGKDEPYLVIVEDHKYALGESSMGKTFVSIPKVLHAKATGILRDAYLQILHATLDHAAEQIIGKPE